MSLENKDFEMVTALKRGEERGVTHFFNLYHAGLLLFARRYLRDIEDAKDVVQYAFIKLFEHRETMYHPKQIKSWLCTTIQNKCFHELKIISKKEGDIPEIADDSLRNLVAAQTHEALYVYEAIDSLPNKCRDIIVLYYIGNFNSAQIALKLGLAKTTVKNQMRRGIRLLRKKFNTTGEKAIANNEHFIMKIYCRTGSPAKIARLFGLNTNTVVGIRNGTIYKDVIHRHGKYLSQA